MRRRIRREDPVFSSEHDGDVQAKQSEVDERQPALLQIQRMAGNQAAIAAAGQLGNASGSSLSEALAALRPPEAPTLRPALDAGAEARADATSAVVAPKEVTVSDGGAVPTEVRNKLEPQLGSLSDVRVHTGPDASRQADDMGARAFTRGREIFLGAGERDANLIAHEAAHTAHDSTQVAADGAELVHAKLKGTFTALVEKGGPPSAGGKTKKFLAPKNWDKILENLAKYEEIEDTLTTGGTPSDKALAKMTPKMLALLGAVEKACYDWQKANNQDEATAMSDKWLTESKQGRDQPTDDRSKAERRQSVALLLPRIGAEKQSIKSGRWKNELGLNQSNVKSIEKGVDEGQMNKVDKVVFGTPQGGEYKTFFKEDKGFSSRMGGPDSEAGIRQADPMWGARSVAMYRLDQLLGAGVTAKTDFGVVDGKMGIAQQKAEGTKGSEVKWVGSDELKSENEGSVSLEDATLQRCLNRLQLLDAIAGQLDRHDGNYFVQIGPGGEVTGITGIDLDMSFGSDLLSPDQKVAGLNWKGMPPRIDAEFAEAILKVSNNDIKGALKGLLPDAEINSTIKRFEFVQKAVRDAKQAGMLVTNWSKDIAQQDKIDDTQEGNQDKFFKTKTYQGSLQQGAATVYNQIASMVLSMGDRKWFDGCEVDADLFNRRWEDCLTAGTKSNFNSGMGNAIGGVLQMAARRNQFPGFQLPAVFSAMVNAMLGDERWWTKVVITYQEGGDPKDLMYQKAAECLPTALARAKKGVKV